MIRPKGMRMPIGAAGIPKTGVDKSRDEGGMVKKLGYLAIAVIFMFTLLGCATVAHGTSTKIHINSVPQGVAATVDGKTIITPGEVTLKNNQRYTVIFKKDGYEDAYCVIDRKPSGWAWGNAFLYYGAVVGLGGDAVKGGKLWPADINMTLTAKQEKK